MPGAQPYSHLFEDDDDERPAAQDQGEDLDAVLSDAKALGNRLFQEGQFDDAAAAYREGLEKFEACGGRQPTGAANAELRKLAIALYCNSAQTALKCVGSAATRALRSRSMAEKALSLDPRNVKALFRKGCAHAHAEEWERAVEDFTRVLEMEPGSDAARRELEKAQDRQQRAGSRPPAVDPEKLDDAVAAAEDDKAKGSRLFQHGKFYEAYESWNVGIGSLSEFPVDALTGPARKLLAALCNNSAQALLQCPEVDGAPTEMAAAMADKALQLEPGNIKALFRRSSANANAGRWHLARGDLERVLELEPDNATAQQELEKIQEFAEPTPEPVNGARPDFSNPAVVAKTAQKEAEKFRREILAVADGHGGVPKWCQRFNKMQVQAAAWVKHQLEDAEGLQDLITLRGPVVAAMTTQQKEDFLTSVEFMTEMRAQYGDEIDQLLVRA